MSEPPDSRTSLTLLQRLRRAPDDQAAWVAFVGRYGPTVRAWCRHWGLQDADAEDVAQNVLVDLARQMRTFEYRPEAGRFRGWLRTVAHRGRCDFLDARRRHVPGSGDTAVAERLASVEAREDFAQRLDAEWDRELLEIGMKRVRERVEPHTWEAFQLTALEGRSGVAAAEQLGMTVAAVFQAKSRVQKLVRDEVSRLDDE